MKKKIFALSILPVLGFAVLAAPSAYACEGLGFGQGRGGQGEQSFGRGMGPGNGLMTEETREQFRNNFESMTVEERQVLRDERMETREAHREEMEDFTGISHEEMRELHRNGESVEGLLTEQGISEKDAEEFLTEQANERVDQIVQKHELNSDEEQTLRDRIADFVSRILDRWF